MGSGWMNSAERKFLYLALFLFALGGVSRLGFFNKLHPLEMVPLFENSELGEARLAAESDTIKDSTEVEDNDKDSMAISGDDGEHLNTKKKEKSKRKAPAFPININTAGKDDLCFIKGIGPSIAQKIIEHREQKGPFRSAKDLEKVPGIGAKKRASMEEFIKFE